MGRCRIKRNKRQTEKMCRKLIRTSNVMINTKIYVYRKKALMLLFWSSCLQNHTHILFCDSVHACEHLLCTEQKDNWRTKRITEEKKSFNDIFMASSFSVLITRQHYNFLCSYSLLPFIFSSRSLVLLCLLLQDVFIMGYSGLKL